MALPAVAETAEWGGLCEAPSLIPLSLLTGRTCLEWCDLVGRALVLEAGRLSLNPLQALGRRVILGKSPQSHRLRQQPPAAKGLPCAGADHGPLGLVRGYTAYQRLCCQKKQRG